jgi:hypothetical protein
MPTDQVHVGHLGAHANDGTTGNNLMQSWQDHHPALIDCNDQDHH